MAITRIRNLNRNTKLEILNSKQILITEIQMTETRWLDRIYEEQVGNSFPFWSFEHSSLTLVLNFEFWISNFESRESTAITAG
jgi:hypothetical protein